MKYRIFCMGAAAAMLIALGALTFIENGGGHSRYHQHLEEPGYTPCPDHGSQKFCTHLPIVTVNTEGQPIPGEPTEKRDFFGETVYTATPDRESYVNVIISVIDNGKGNNHLDDRAAFTTRSLFRVRGHSSRLFEKSPYLMKFVDENGLDRNIEVMGMPAHNEWALNGPYLDKSLVRNYMWYNIAGEIMDDYVPQVRYCELFLNGEYRGLYLMTETVTAGDGCRLNLKTASGSNKFTGYLLRIDRPEESELESVRDIYSLTERLNITGGDIAIRYPGRDSLTPEIKKEIELDFSAFEKALLSYDHNNKKYGFSAWADTDNFVDYYLINEFTGNVDMGSYSTYIYRQPGDKLRLCVWDFNNSCDNYTEKSYGYDDFVTAEAGHYAFIIKDESYGSKVIKRYRQLRKTYLDESYLNGYIDSTVKWLGPAVGRNYDRWKAAFDSDMLFGSDGTGARVNAHTTEEAAVQLKKWLEQRGKWLDAHIDAFNSFSHGSRNKRWNR